MNIECPAGFKILKEGDKIPHGTMACIKSLTKASVIKSGWIVSLSVGSVVMPIEGNNYFCPVTAMIYPVDLEAAGLWLSHDGQDRLTVEFGKLMISEIKDLRAQVLAFHENYIEAQ